MRLPEDSPRHGPKHVAAIRKSQCKQKHLIGLYLKYFLCSGSTHQISMNRVHCTASHFPYLTPYLETSLGKNSVLLGRPRCSTACVHQLKHEQTFCHFNCFSIKSERPVSRALHKYLFLSGISSVTTEDELRTHHVTVSHALRNCICNVR